jgi:hypothetical protein
MFPDHAACSPCQESEMAMEILRQSTWAWKHEMNKNVSLTELRL